MSDKPGDDETRRRLESAYDRFAEHVVDALRAGRDLGRQGIEAAMKTARSRLSGAGEFSAAQGERFTAWLRRDLGLHLEEQARQAREFGRAVGREGREFGHEAAQKLNPARLRDGTLATLATLLRSSGETLQAWSEKADAAVVYVSGEITSAGTLTCLSCGHVAHLEQTAHIAPCPACLGTRFRKSY